MKKWLLGILAIIIILLVAPYFYVPSNLVVSKVISVSASSNEASRVLINENSWPGWWPKEKASIEPPIFKYNRFTYHLSQKFYNSIELNIAGDGFDDSSRINIIKITNDSTLIEWRSQVTASKNPIKRIQQYSQAVLIKYNMNDIMAGLKSYLDNNGNVYGVQITQIISKDSTLMSTNRISNAYPTTTHIYQIIDSIRSHIAKEGGKENNVPMLSVSKLATDRYETIVAIPVNGKLKETSTIVNKRFVPWKTLTGDVKGGVQAVDKALIQMQIYIDDHQRNAMGIPFQSLITDRRAEPDSTKWVTKICQAVS